MMTKQGFRTSRYRSQAFWISRLARVVFGLIALHSTPAAAGVIGVTLTGITGSPGAYTWNYTAELDGALQGGSVLRATGFTLYDIEGLDVASVTVPANFTDYVMFYGIIPGQVTISDSATVNNLNLFYTGADVELSNPMSLPFSFKSSYDSGSVGYLSFQTPTVEGVERLPIPGSGSGTVNMATALSVAQVGTSAPVAGDYRTTFDVESLGSGGLGSGSYFTIYDLPVVDVTPPSSFWSCYVALNGYTAPNTLPSDSNAVSNVTCLYTGPQVAPASGPLGQLTVVTSTPVSNPQFASGTFATETGYTISDLIRDNPTPDEQLVGAVAQASAAPEPSTAACCALVAAVWAAVVLRAKFVQLRSTRPHRFA